MYAAVRQACGIEFAFDREDRHSHANSHTFYLRYVGPLPAGRGVKVDITIREEIVFPLEGQEIRRVLATGQPAMRALLVRDQDDDPMASTMAM